MTKEFTMSCKSAANDAKQNINTIRCFNKKKLKIEK